MRPSSNARGRLVIGVCHLPHSFVIAKTLSNTRYGLEAGLSGWLKKMEDDLARLEEEDAQLLAQRESIDRQLSEHDDKKLKLKTAIEVARSYAPDDTGQLPQSIGPRTPDGRHHGVWPAAGRAGVEIIRKSGRPWQTRELLAELQRIGFVFGSSEPLGNLSGVLGKTGAVRSHKTGWHLTEWPERPAQVDERLTVLRSFVKRQSNENKELPAPSPTKPFFGIGLPQACVDVLVQNKQPLGNVEIAKRLEDAGFPFPSKDHASSVEGALRRRVKSHDDVARVQAGTWGLLSWYTEDEIRGFADAIGKVPGRDTKAHTEATRAAVQSRKEQGVRFGRLPKFDDATMDRAIDLLENGVSSRDVAKTLGVTAAAVLKWKRKRKEKEASETTAA
jgi:hypothetical protein